MRKKFFYQTPVVESIQVPAAEPLCVSPTYQKYGPFGDEIDPSDPDDYQGW